MSNNITTNEQTPTAPPVGSSAWLADGLRRELQSIGELAVSERASERLAGNIVKEMQWVGQLAVCAQISRWLERESANESSSETAR